MKLSKLKLSTRITTPNRYITTQRYSDDAVCLLVVSSISRIIQLCIFMKFFEGFASKASALGKETDFSGDDFCPDLHAGFLSLLLMPMRESLE